MSSWVHDHFEWEEKYIIILKEWFLHKKHVTLSKCELKFLDNVNIGKTWIFQKMMQVPQAWKEIKFIPEMKSQANLH